MASDTTGSACHHYIMLMAHVEAFTDGLLVAVNQRHQGTSGATLHCAFGNIIGGTVSYEAPIPHLQPGMAIL